MIINSKEKRGRGDGLALIPGEQKKCWSSSNTWTAVQEAMFFQGVRSEEQAGLSNGALRLEFQRQVFVR